MTRVLEASDLAGERGRARLFSGISLRIEPGHALALTGANGSGKTTLLRVLAGLSAPAAGTLRWDGEPVAPFDARLRGATVFSGHLAALKDELSARENLASLVALAGVSATEDELGAALDAVALSRQQALPARVLSQGQRRRIGLARLRLLRKPLWLLDEPATALDADGVAILAQTLRAHLDDGGSAVVATHQPLGLPADRAATLVLDARAP